MIVSETITNKALHIFSTHIIITKYRIQKSHRISSLISTGLSQFSVIPGTCPIPTTPTTTAGCIPVNIKDITDTVNDVCMVTVATLQNWLQLRPACVPYGRLLFVRDITITSALCMSRTNQSSSSHRCLYRHQQYKCNDDYLFGYLSIHLVQTVIVTNIPCSLSLC